MPSNLSRLRRWFAAAIVAALLLVAGTYFYARHRVQNALKQIPEKIGLEIKQTATGFTISKSQQGRSLFTIQASKAVQFKKGGHTELHDVQITLYGSDSSQYNIRIAYSGSSRMDLHDHRFHQLHRFQLRAGYNQFVPGSGEGDGWHGRGNDNY